MFSAVMGSRCVRTRLWVSVACREDWNAVESHCRGGGWKFLISQWARSISAVLAHLHTEAATCVWGFLPLYLGLTLFRKFYNYNMKSAMQSLLLILALALSVSAQFQFFEQFFGGEQQQHQPQNVPSDSSWYRQNYAKGKLTCWPMKAVIFDY